VYVLAQVLEKVHRVLRVPGLLLNITPTHKISPVTVEHKGEVVYSGTLEEPNFKTFLTATQRATETAVERGLYAVLATSLDGYVGEYSSVDEWIDEFLPLSDDKGELHEMEASLISATEHLPGDFVIKHHWEEQATLLKKQG
jgi:hypothetical protein